jgi:NAD(P)-dependent dehydrogenase (short-subunit alcohol dehydrogenase family)
VLFLTRAAWPQLKASHGVVVNTASLNALMSFKTLGSLAQTTAKAGIIGMTRQLAMEGREQLKDRASVRDRRLIEVRSGAMPAVSG